MGCVQSKKNITSNYLITNQNIRNQQNSEGQNKNINHNRDKRTGTYYSYGMNKSINNFSIKRLTQLSSSIRIQNIIQKNENRPEDNYKIISKTGKGSFGSVYKVINNKTGMIRAMKVISKETINYQDDERVFLKEIEILTKLQHPNIVKIFEYYVDEVNYYLITEFISGGELYDAIVKSNEINEQKSAYIMSQIIDALNYLHSNGIVHRDIKTENILVLSNSTENKINIKLIDFGTCNYITDGNNLTLKVGSPYYIAPEVLKKNYNEKCDIWSAGVILYILLIGRPPFKGRDQNELFSLISKGEFCKSGQEWDSLSPEAQDLILKMLEYDPEKRFSAQQCNEHPWIAHYNENKTVDLLPSVLTNIYNLNEREKFQQAIIAYIIHSINSNKEIDELQKVFKALDLNGDGKLTYREIKIGFEKYFGKSLSELKLNKIIEEIDANADGVISYEEFLRVSVNQKIFLDDKNLQLAFDRFDENKDGKLSKEEIKNVFDNASSEYIEALIEMIDNNKDGYISYGEFKNFMKGVIGNKNSTICSKILGHR